MLKREGGFTHIEPGQLKAREETRAVGLRFYSGDGGNNRKAHAPDEAQGLEPSLWSSLASSAKGNTGNPWQSHCQLALPPVQNQIREGSVPGPSKGTHGSAGKTRTSFLLQLKWFHLSLRFYGVHCDSFRLANAASPNTSKIFKQMAIRSPKECWNSCRI